MRILCGRAYVAYDEAHRFVFRAGIRDGVAAARPREGEDRPRRGGESDRRTHYARCRSAADSRGEQPLLRA